MVLAQFSSISENWIGCWSIFSTKNWKKQKRQQNECILNSNHVNKKQFEKEIPNWVRRNAVDGIKWNGRSNIKRTYKINKCHTTYYNAKICKLYTTFSTKKENDEKLLFFVFCFITFKVTCALFIFPDKLN